MIVHPCDIRATPLPTEGMLEIIEGEATQSGDHEKHFHR